MLLLYVLSFFEHQMIGMAVGLHIGRKFNAQKYIRYICLFTNGCIYSIMRKSRKKFMRRKGV